MASSSNRPHSSLNRHSQPVATPSEELALAAPTILRQDVTPPHYSVYCVPHLEVVLCHAVCYRRFWYRVLARREQSWRISM